MTETTTRTATVRNGIDVDQLLGTIEHVKDDAGAGAFTFRASSSWKDGTHNIGEIGRFIHAGQEDDSRQEPFRLEGDEPPVLLGSNQGPIAVELLLQASGSATRSATWPTPPPAASRSRAWTTRSRETSTWAASSGWMGPRAGFTEIRVRSTVSSPNTGLEELRELCQYVQDTSPVRDSLAAAVPVKTTLEVV